MNEQMKETSFSPKGCPLPPAHPLGVELSAPFGGFNFAALSHVVMSSPPDRLDAGAHHSCPTLLTSPRPQRGGHGHSQRRLLSVPLPRDSLPSFLHIPLPTGSPGTTPLAILGIAQVKLKSPSHALASQPALLSGITSSPFRSRKEIWGPLGAFPPTIHPPFPLPRPLVSQATGLLSHCPTSLRTHAPSPGPQVPSQGKSRAATSRMEAATGVKCWCCWEVRNYHLHTFGKPH